MELIYSYVFSRVDLMDAADEMRLLSGLPFVCIANCNLADRILARGVLREPGVSLSNGRYPS